MRRKGRSSVPANCFKLPRLRRRQCDHTLAVRRYVTRLIQFTHLIDGENASHSMTAPWLHRLRVEPWRRARVRWLKKLEQISRLASLISTHIVTMLIAPVSSIIINSGAAKSMLWHGNARRRSRKTAETLIWIIFFPLLLFTSPRVDLSASAEPWFVSDVKKWHYNFFSSPPLRLLRLASRLARWCCGRLRHVFLSSSRLCTERWCASQTSANVLPKKKKKK